MEDDSQPSAMLEELLLAEGYDVSRARDGQHGLHLGLTEDFDVMIMDHGLEVVGGLMSSRSCAVRALRPPLSALGDAQFRSDFVDYANRQHGGGAVR